MVFKPGDIQSEVENIHDQLNIIIALPVRIMIVGVLHFWRSQFELQRGLGMLHDSLPVTQCSSLESGTQGITGGNICRSCCSIFIVHIYNPMS